MLVWVIRECPACFHTALRTTRGHYSVDCRTRTPGGHQATTEGVLVGLRRRREVHYNKWPTQGYTSLDGVRGGCSGARRWSLWHAAAAAACTGPSRWRVWKSDFARGPPSRKCCPRQAAGRAVRTRKLPAADRGAVRAVRAGPGDGDMSKRKNFWRWQWNW